MEKHRRERIEELHRSALGQSPESRSEFLAHACQGDSELLRDVQDLLAHDQGAISLAGQELKEGTELGPYRILGMLGSGGMGCVYRAEDSRLGRTVAIKVLRANAANDSLRHRFRSEAKAISSLSHPNICPLYDIGTLPGGDFLVMECLGGETLADTLRKGPLPVATVLTIGANIAAGLAAAHEKRIVHRDLKPSNVMLTPSGAKILDFGIAKTFAAGSAGTAVTLTLEGAVMGTPAYMAPEQFGGGHVDARTDIFAAGLILYEMATGKRPSAPNTPPQMAKGRPGSAPALSRSPKVKVPPALERIIQKCLQSEPELRYQSAKELEHDLRRAARVPDRMFSRKGLLLAATIVVVSIAILLLWRFARPFRPGNIESLAVLPLDNLSGDPAQDYFADGMTEVLITDLGKIASLRVISRPSVMRFKGTRAPLRDVANELKVDGLVIGSVARAEGKVRVTTQLYHAGKDRQLWAEIYERDMRDVIALQREVAQAITNEIRIKVTAQESARLAKSRRVVPEAYDAYLRGVLLYGRHSEPDNKAGIEIMRRAVALDPNFAAAQALLALAYVERLFTFAPRQRKELEEKAYIAVEKTISLDPDDALAYLARGRLLWTPNNRFPHERAIREYRRSLALNPNLAEARAQLALTYNHIGLLDKALREARASADVNPVDALPRVVIGQALLYGGQYDRALSVWSNNPPDAYASVTGSHLAWTLLQMGRREQAAEKLQEFLGKYPDDVGGIGVQSALLPALGRKQEAEAAIRSIADQKGFGHFHHSAYYIACAYARMGNIDASLEWLREAAESGFPCYPLFERDSKSRTVTPRCTVVVLHGGAQGELDPVRQADL